MASREVTNAIVALLRQGYSSAEIAKRVNVSGSVVWGVKAHWVQGKYEDKSVRTPDGTNTRDENNYAQKAVAILAGYLNKSASGKDNDALLKDAAPEFARLLALITCSKKSLRDSAKQSIRDYASAGGWNLQPQETVEDVPAIHVPADLRKKRRGGKWRIEDQATLTDTWNNPDSKKNGYAIQRLSESLGRTPLALIIRLYQMGMISVATGDALCADSGAPILLSETNVVRRRDDAPQSVQEVQEDGNSFDNRELTQEDGGDSDGARTCISCRHPIPSARLKLIPNALRCAKCQSHLENFHDFHRYVDEGLPGTREAHKQMRGQDWSDMRKRGRD